MTGVQVSPSFDECDTQIVCNGLPATFSAASCTETNTL